MRNRYRLIPLACGAQFHVAWYSTAKRMMSSPSLNRVRARMAQWVAPHHIYPQRIRTNSNQVVRRVTRNDKIHGSIPCLGIVWSDFRRNPFSINSYRPIFLASLSFRAPWLTFYLSFHLSCSLDEALSLYVSKWEWRYFVFTHFP